jgi:hypothetical protein
MIDCKEETSIDYFGIVLVIFDHLRVANNELETDLGVHWRLFVQEILKGESWEGDSNEVRIPENALLNQSTSYRINDKTFTATIN